MNFWQRATHGWRALFGDASSQAAPSPRLAADLRQTLHAAVANQALRPGEEAAILAALRAGLLGAVPRPRFYRSAHRWLSATVACALVVLSLALPRRASPVVQATAPALPAAELTSDLSRAAFTQRGVQSATPSSIATLSATPVPHLALHASAYLPVPSGTLDVTSRQ